MSLGGSDRLQAAVFLFYAIFVFASAFSIALAQLALGLSLIGFLAIVIRDRFLPFVGALKWFHLAAGAYLVWLTLSVLFGPTANESLSSVREEWLFLAIPIGVYLMREEGLGRKLIEILAVSVALLVVYGLIQYFTGANWFREGQIGEVAGFGHRVQGNFSTRLTYANYFGTAALFLAAYALHRGKELSGRLKITLLVISIGSLVVTVLTFSRGVTLACVAALLILGWLLGKRYRLAVLAVVVVIALAISLVPGVRERYVGGMANDLDAEYEGSRLFIWGHTVDMITEHPVFGVGPGNFHPNYRSRLRPDAPVFRHLTHAHNDPLNIAAQSGVAAALLFEAMWLVLLVLLWRGYRDPNRSESDRRLCLAALMGSLVFWLGSMTEATFADEEVRQLLMFIWAAGLSVWYKGSPAATDGSRASLFGQVLQEAKPEV